MSNVSSEPEAALRYLVVEGQESRLPATTVFLATEPTRQLSVAGFNIIPQNLRRGSNGTSEAAKFPSALTKPTSKLKGTGNIYTEQSIRADICLFSS